MGEISVLVVAATGVASMVFRNRRFGAAPESPRRGPPAVGQPDIGLVAAYSPAAGDVTWLRGSELRDPRHRSLVLEVATRIIFPLIMVLSAYLFFAGHNTPGGGFAGGPDRRAWRWCCAIWPVAVTNSARRCHWTPGRCLGHRTLPCPQAPR